MRSISSEGNGAGLRALTRLATLADLSRKRER